MCSPSCQLLFDAGRELYQVNIDVSGRRLHIKKKHHNPLNAFASDKL